MRHDDPELGAIAGRLAGYARRYERERDSRCVFSHAYALLTQALDRDLAAADPEHVEFLRALAGPFAERYFTALDAWDAGRRDEVSPGWRIVFERIVTRRTSPIEDLVVGVYAHIVHDLPYALAGVAEDGRIGPIAAYQRVSDVIAAAMEDITGDVGRRYTPWIGWLDRLAGDDDEVLSDYGIRVARGMAWYNAERLLDPGTRADARRALDRSTLVFVQRVLEPRAIAAQGLALRGLRLLTSLFRRWPDEGS
jgi:Family of unknown function (DUF5995)